MDIVVVDQDVVRELNIFEEMVDTVGQQGKLTMYKCRKCSSEFTGRAHPSVGIRKSHLLERNQETDSHTRLHLHIFR